MSIEIVPAELSCCSYATPADLVKRFGLAELQCVSNKNNCNDEELCEGTESWNTVICALNDAKAEMDQFLCCCFDMKKICKWVKEGKKFSMLIKWQSDLARYFLQDVVSYNGTTKTETEAYRRYKKARADIEFLCSDKCDAPIIDETGECCCNKTSKCGFAVAKRKKSCIPEICCKQCGCNKGNCACYSANCGSKNPERCSDKRKINSYVSGVKK